MSITIFLSSLSPSKESSNLRVVLGGPQHKSENLKVFVKQCDLE